MQATAAVCVTRSASNVCTANADTEYHSFNVGGLLPCTRCKGCMASTSVATKLTSTCTVSSAMLCWLQGSFQVCLNAGQASEQGAHFLADGCRPLKAAFANDNLMLRPAAAGVPPGGQTILWYATFCFCWSKALSFLL